MKPQHIIVIGASAGGMNALSELVKGLNREMDAAFFIVLHLSGKGMGQFLIYRLQQQTPLPCKLAVNGEEIRRGTIYIAPPDEHLLLKDDRVLLGNGPSENRWRPSINVLFRSAAASYGSRSTGIILTGLLDDGTSGMLAIRRSGGSTIVQDPNESEYPDMALSVLNNMEVDYCVSLSEMGNSITEIIRTKNIEQNGVPEDVKQEAEIAERVLISLDRVSRLGDKALYACPDCGGGLWNIREEQGERYRCHVGHVFSEGDLDKRQYDSLENTFWTALRMMEERRNLLKQMGLKEKAKGLHSMGDSHLKRAAEMEEHIENLKRVLYETQSSESGRR